MFFYGRIGSTGILLYIYLSIIRPHTFFPIMLICRIPSVRTPEFKVVHVFLITGRVLIVAYL